MGTWKAEFPATGMRKALQREFGGERFVSAISARIGIAGVGRHLMNLDFRERFWLRKKLRSHQWM